MKPAKNLILLLLLFFIQRLSADEYELNQTALHLNARDFSLGGFICNMEPVPNQSIEVTYLAPYQLKELSTRKLEFYRTFQSMDGKIGWSQSGTMDWMENYLTLHLGKKLNDVLYLGVTFDVLLIDDVLDKTICAFFAEVDCHYLLSEKVTIGLSLVNPSGASIQSFNKKIPLSSAAFLATRMAPTKTCLLFGELGTGINQKVIARLGLEYTLTKALILRTGLSTEPLMPCWGIGGSVHHFNYSWGGNMHPILGISNGFTLNYSW